MDIKNTQGEVIMTIEAESAQQHDFYRANLEGVNFEEAVLEGVRFYAANLKGANFKGAKLRKANFQVANLEGANLKWADLSYVNFLGANLCGADLSEANVKWAVWKATKYNASTKFPKDFDPKQYELVLMTEAGSAS